MQIVRLMGGLGNQMFQYAFGQVLGKDVLYDISWFDEVKTKKNATQRIYELDNFNADVKLVRIKKETNFYPKFIRNIFSIPKYKNFIYEQLINVFQPELLNKEGIFEGYFQTEKYFADKREQIIKDFSVKNPLNYENFNMLKEIKEQPNSISIHIRRGDYVKHSNVHFLCGVNYYEKAINLISTKVKNPYFFIFSDDTDWVKNNLNIKSSYKIVNINSANNGYLDLELMKNCKHNIIANSTFSWWGAWLNTNPDKIVIAPKKWHLDNQHGEWDTIPEHWIQIKEEKDFANI